MTTRGYAKGRAKRAEILDTAVSVFSEVGFRGASVREIAARSGISHPGLLHHFPTKEALLMAVLARRDDLGREASVRGGAGGADRLFRLVDLAAGDVGRPHMIELFTTLSAEATDRDHPAHTFFMDRYRRTVAEIAEAYRAARDEGALRTGIGPDDAARELVALMDGLQVQWLYDPDRVDLVALLRRHLERQLVVTGESDSC